MTCRVEIGVSFGEKPDSIFAPARRDRFPALVQLHRSDRRKWLRDRGKPVQCAGCGRHEVFQIGHAEAGGPDELSVFNYGN